MLQRYEKGGEKGASVRALAPDFFPALVPFFILAPFPGLCRFFSRSALLGLCPFPATRSATCSAARPLFPLRYVPSRSLFRLRCVRPFLSACRRRPSGPPLSRARRRSSRVAAQTSAHSPVSPFYAFRHPFPAPLCALRSAAAPRNVFSAEKLPDSPGKNAKNHTSRFVTIFDCYFFHIPKSFYTFVPSNSVLRAAARRGAGRRPGPAPQCADDHRTKDLRFY